MESAALIAITSLLAGLYFGFQTLFDMLEGSEDFVANLVSFLILLVTFIISYGIAKTEEK